MVFSTKLVSRGIVPPKIIQGMSNLIPQMNYMGIEYAPLKLILDIKQAC